MKVFGQLESAQLEVLSADPVGQAYPGRVYYHKTLGVQRMYDAVSGAWVTIGSAASGGLSNSIHWTNEGPNGAVLDTENSQPVYIFQNGAEQVIDSSIRLPLSYGSSVTSANPIKIYVAAYTPGSSGTFLLRCRSYLIKIGTDVANTTARFHESSNAPANASTANLVQIISLDVTDSDGKIGGTTVSPGDVIKLQLYRGGGTNTENVRLLATPSEVDYS